MYELTNNIVKNNSVLLPCHYFIMTITMLFHYNWSNKKAAATNKCTSIVGHFDSHDDEPVGFVIFLDQ
jgi:hypothetical protein